MNFLSKIKSLGLKIWNRERSVQTTFIVISVVALILSLTGIRVWGIDPAWVAVILCGSPIIKWGIESLIELTVTSSLLVTIALIAALIIDETFAAGEVALIMALGDLLQDVTVAKARAGIGKLINYMPATARLITGGVENIVPADQVKKGDIFRVIGGESIPADGLVVKGESAVDESIMTGESLPVDKEPGDQVLSGTVNQFGLLEIEATADNANSSLARMIRLVDSADARKAKIVGIADRWAKWIISIAIISAAGTWLVTGEAIRAVAILVVFCPCALVLATPTAIMGGIGNASRRGVLIRQGDALERLSRIDSVIFDKTGTLTYGQPQVAAIYSPLFAESDLLRYAAGAEANSEHPLGRTIVAYYLKETNSPIPEVSNFKLIPGQGVYALCDSKRIIAGNLRLLSEQKIAIPEQFIAEADKYKMSGSTVIFLAVDDQPAGFIALADRIRPSAAAAIKEIREMGLTTLLVSGDHENSVRNIASQVGITDFRFDCLPEKKLEILEELHQAGHQVGMVGDGVNDAPALKASDAGIAMGGIGSDIAIEAADAVFVNDDPGELPRLLRLARKTMNTIHANLTLSIVLNFIAIGFAMVGVLGPVGGALVHNAGSFVVVVNSALILRWKGKKK